MKQLFCAAAVAALLLGLAGDAAGQQRGRGAQPPRDAQGARAERPGTGSISGVVLMAGSTQPARKVRVNLSGAELRGSRFTTTDDQGRFSFTALPPGRYSLSATKPGHVTVSYGQRRPGTPGTPIQLGDGQQFAVQMQIPRGSVVTGIVLDEQGEATPGTPVRALRRVVQNGRPTLQSAGTGTTDDRGIYRIYGLPPGHYVVCATPRNVSAGPMGALPAEVQAMIPNVEAMLGGLGAGVIDAQVQQRLADAQQAMGQPQEEASAGYAPVCYPGTTAVGEAAPIQIGIGEERPGVDFQLQLTPLARVEGTVVNSTGAPLQNVQVTLVNAHGVSAVGGTNTTRADAEGRFRFSGVTPGQYRIQARMQTGGGGRGAAMLQGMLLGGRGRGGAAPAAATTEPATWWAAADIVVDGRNMSNVMLALQPGLTLSGQITFEGTTPPPSDLTRLRVTMTSTEPGPGMPPANGRVDASGRFTVTNLTPGQYRLSVTGAQGWTAESAVVGGYDALDFPVEIRAGQAISGAAVTMTDRQTEITGVLSQDDQPAPDYTVVIFPSDQRYWTGSSRRIQSARPATDGRFTFRNLPPGEYRVAAVFDPEPGATSDPAFLSQLEATSLRVTLQAGEKKVQDIRLR
ncbi:MAG TPA: carboxypeptidase regulatory-like domain-containing protein [Vicinamibacterales bacterium]|nr:carboxypeptidase regulatory-like domain-containing protein [Vicinamibacterales bacterium]